ncbi:MAG: hypothetical protein IT380_28910 [Myxococcales bacterium]|nr:hypothetical protein [Myxococcales bacterium]
MRPLRVTYVTGASGVLAVLVGLTACGRPAPPRDLPEPGNLLARVTAPSGAPVAAALFAGRGAFTDDDGLATGLLEDTGGGFTRLEAPGYATTWTKPLPGDVEGKRLVLARLTPLEAVVEVHPDGPRAVELDEGGLRDVRVALPPRAFPLPATLSVARVRPQDLGPVAFAPREAGLGQHLQRAFWLEGAMEGVPAPTFAPVQLTVRHPERFGPPSLGRFESTSGGWRAAPGACERSSADEVHCTVSALGLWGLFGEARPDTTGEAWTEAQHALFQALFEPADGANTPPALAFAAAARTFADAHGGVAGLHALLAAAAVASWTAEAPLARELLTRAAPALAGLVAAEDGSDCGRMVRLAHLRELGRAAGLTRAQRRTLDERLDLNQWTCDVWVGWVYSVLALAPSDEEGTGWRVGQGSWSERHAVRLAVDEFSGVTGHSQAEVRLPRALYRDDTDGPASCGDDFRQLELRGEPASSQVGLSVQGSVAADAWTLTTSPAEAEAGPKLLVREQVQRWLEGGDACLLVEDTDVSRTAVEAYTSLLGDGFGAPSPLTLQQMLSDGARADNPLGVGLPDRHGFARVTLAPGAEGWPVTGALMRWRFFQVTPRHQE